MASSPDSIAATAASVSSVASSPEPGPGEALISWLGRLAGLYRLSVEQLLTHNLGAASAEFDRDADLDYQAPTIIVHALAARTGIEVDRLHRMTIAGCVPWLADTLNPAEGPQSFANYARKEFGAAATGPGRIPRDQPLAAILLGV